MNWRVADHTDYEKKGGQGDWGDGVLTVSLRSWEEFHAETSRLLDLGDFVWRGQRLDWPLKSKFDRLIEGNRNKALKNHKEAFRRAIRGRRGDNPPPLAEDDEIWSLGQHYGLPTPLLDWTESPFVAAFFAFEEAPVAILRNAMVNVQLAFARDALGKEQALKGAPCRCIYGLSKDIIRWGPVRSLEAQPDEQFVEFVDSPSDENPRLLNQRGLFTKSLFPESIEDRVRRCYATKDERTKGRSRIILIKIQIPEIERPRCLRDLNRMNINHATLFPDLTGSARYCAMKLEIEDY